MIGDYLYAIVMVKDFFKSEKQRSFKEKTENTYIRILNFLHDKRYQENSLKKKNTLWKKISVIC